MTTNADRPLQNKVALISGASSGIGRATALAFAAAGASVLLVARRSFEGEAVADEICRVGGKAVFFCVDLTRDGAAEAAVAHTIRHYGRLDLAFNNAGIEGRFSSITELSAGDFDATIGTNLRAVWLGIKHQFAAMRSQGGGGVIINTSSWLSYGAFPSSSLYSASKAGLDGLMRAVALEGAPQCIRVNNINPGIIDTPMLRRFGDDEALRPFVAHTPAGRLGTAEEIADAVVWLCSDAARFITGQNLNIAGGFGINGFRSAPSPLAETLT